MKKYLALILALVMACGILTACGDPNAAAGSKTPSAPAATETTPAPAASTESSAAPAAAEIKWPTQPVNMMCPAAAGGGTDMILRMMNEYFMKLTGQSWVINNVKGVAGYEQVYQSNPDGYNFICGTTTILTSKDDGTFDYDWSGYEMVGFFEGDYTTVIAVQADSPYQTINDLLDAAKANPQGVTGGITLSGQPYMFAQALNEAVGGYLYYVDTGNTSERNAALLGGQVDYIVTNIPSSKGYVESGDFRFLAIDGNERYELAPDVPTFKEQGVDFVFYAQPIIWLAPKGTDRAVCEKFNEILNQIYTDPNFAEDYKTKMNSISHELPSVDESVALAQEYSAAFSKYVTKK